MLMEGGREKGGQYLPDPSGRMDVGTGLQRGPRATEQALGARKATGHLEVTGGVPAQWWGWVGPSRSSRLSLTRATRTRGHTQTPRAPATFSSLDQVSSSNGPADPTSTLQKILEAEEQAEPPTERPLDTCRWWNLLQDARPGVRATSVA